MPFSKSTFFNYTTLALLLCSTMSFAAESQRHEQTVTDLAYGSSLYHLYQDNKLSAITDLEAGFERQSLINQPDDADLLLAGLYFEYGLPDESEQILNRLLDEETADDIKNRVWFNLARVQYEINNVQQAEQLLSRISDKLPPQREAQKHYILSNIYIYNQQFDQAVEATSAIQADSIWSAYAEYNLGVSLLKSAQNESGQLRLKKLIARQTQQHELLSLQDSARLAAGLSSLRQKQPQQTIQSLGEIHSSSAFTNKALLATGWAWSQLSQPEKALNYWFTLIDKKQADGATQEAHLAIAYAYEQLDNKARAIQYYEQALKQFAQQQTEMDQAISSIQQMDLIGALYRERIIQPGLQTVSNDSLPQHQSTPWLHKMFASKSFQQALTNYQELLDIHDSLIQWKNTLPALGLMLSERINSFENKRELVKQTTDFEQLENLQQQRDELAQEVLRIEQSKDFLALANEDETDYLEQLEDVQGLLSKLQGQQDLSDENQKYRLMSGLLQWDISTDYPRRYWRIVRQLQLLDRALEKTKKSALSLQQASAINELKLNDFNQRISGQGEELHTMEIKTSQLIEQQEQLINKLATEVILGRQQHLDQLRLSARYSLTRLYDEISKPEITQ